MLVKLQIFDRLGFFFSFLSGSYLFNPKHHGLQPKWFNEKSLLLLIYWHHSSIKRRLSRISFPPMDHTNADYLIWHSIFHPFFAVITSTKFVFSTVIFPLQLGMFKRNNPPHYLSFFFLWQSSFRNQPCPLGLLLIIYFVVLLFIVVQSIEYFRVDTSLKKGDASVISWRKRDVWRWCCRFLIVLCATHDSPRKFCLGWPRPYRTGRVGDHPAAFFQPAASFAVVGWTPPPVSIERSNLGTGGDWISRFVGLGKTREDLRCFFSRVLSSPPLACRESQLWRVDFVD